MIPFSKLWQHTVNQPVGSFVDLTTCCQTVMLAIKNALIGFTSSHWTCWGSCDGAGNFGNNDGNDRWAAIAKLVWAAATGTAHSWIVLEQPGLSGAQICIDLLDGTLANRYNCTIVFSPTGAFGAPGSGGTGADGTATARPTAGDEIVLISAAAWGAYTAAYMWRLHVMQSTDGECTRVVMTRDGASSALWLFDRVKNPIVGWATPVIGCVIASSAVATSIVTYASLSTAAATYGKIGSDTCAFYMTYEAYGTTGIPSVTTTPDDDTNEWPVFAVGLQSSSTKHRGRKGELYDFWWAPNANATGPTYPDDSTRLLMQFLNILLPWNGSVPYIWM